MATKKPRVTAFVTPETKQKIKDICDSEKQSESVTASKLIEDGLKLTEQPESALSYQQKIADQMLKK